MLKAAAILILCSFGCTAFAADLSGEYTGTSVTDDGSHSATVRLILKKKTDGAWDCKFSFNVDGDDVTTKTISCTADETKLSGEYEAEVQGNLMHILLDGTAKDDRSLEGKIRTTSPSGGDVIAQGTWKASPKQ